METRTSCNTPLGSLPTISDTSIIFLRIAVIDIEYAGLHPMKQIQDKCILIIFKYQT
jgi:hypothetical protein